jgi:hypothetical protein
VWQATLPQPGPWLVYVSAFAIQNTYAPPDYAAIGEQIAAYP